MAIDYSIFTADPFDPCAALAALRPVYYQLAIEGKPTKITFRDRTVEFGKVDLAGIKDLMRQLETDCAAVSGKRVNFAITAGSRRPFGVLDPFRR